MVGALQAGDMRLGVLQLGLILEAVDFAEDGAFAELKRGFREVRLGLLHIRAAFFRVSPMLGDALIYLALQVLKFALRLPGVVNFLAPVEFGQYLAGLDFRSAGNELLDRHAPPLPLDR